MKSLIKNRRNGKPISGTKECALYNIQFGLVCMGYIDIYPLEFGFN